MRTAGTTLTQAELDALIEAGKVLEVKSNHPAVIESESEHATIITKLWWPKPKLLASARPSVKCWQFINAASQLRQLGFGSPAVRNHGSVEGVNAYWVDYPKIAGDTLRDMVTEGRPPTREQLAAFLLEIHDHGIYYRALNMGNMVLGGGVFSLIDVQDTRFFGRPLTVEERARNLSHLMTHPRDIGPMFEGYGQALVLAYADTWDGDEKRLRTLVRKFVRRRTKERIRRRARTGLAPLPITGIPKDW